LAAHLHQRLGPIPRTPEQVYLANRDVWNALDNEARQRQLDVRFEPGNQAAKNRRDQVAGVRDRQAESASECGVGGLLLKAFRTLVVEV